MDPFESFKAAQKIGWVQFAPLESLTTPPAAQLVKHARVRSGQRVLDVACGTGVVAITAARKGAHTQGLDLTPGLLERARANAQVANVDIDWREGDVEDLPFENNQFDVVLSQFGHIFAPRPEVAIAEMLRVLKPGGTIAFSTWPPELLLGRVFALAARFGPPPTPGVAPPTLWGDPRIVVERLGTLVKDITFDRGRMLVPALSPQHFRAVHERSGGSVVKVVEYLSAGASEKLAAFRGEYDALVAEYFDENIVRQDFLLTRASKI